MPHAMFPHPEGLPPADDDREFARLYILRDGKYHPDAFPPEAIQGEEFFKQWGGGNYQLIARGSDGRISARSPIYSIAGPSLPFVVERPASGAGVPPPSGGPDWLPTIISLATAFGPLYLEHQRAEREERARRDAREREDRDRREQREEQRHREMLQLMTASQASQLQATQTFADKLMQTQTAMVREAGTSPDLKQFYDGLEFAKGMYEKNSGGDVLTQLAPLAMQFMAMQKARAPGPPPSPFVGVPSQGAIAAHPIPMPVPPPPGVPHGGS